MSDTLTRKDWETARVHYASCFIRDRTNWEASEFMMKRCDEEISKFPKDEKDPMPDAVKEIIDEVKK